MINNILQTCVPWRVPPILCCLPWTGGMCTTACSQRSQFERAGHQRKHSHAHAGDPRQKGRCTNYYNITHLSV